MYYTKIKNNLKQAFILYTLLYLYALFIYLYIVYLYSKKGPIVITY